MSCILRVHCKCLINTCWINKNHFWLSGTIEAFAAAAAAKSLQSCLTLCDPIDGSPPGSPVPGILQARVLEWAAISFSNAWKWKVKMKSLSHAWLLATPWTAARQAPPPMGFSKQEYWSGLPLPWVCLKAHMKTTKGLGEVLDTQVLASYLETVTVHDASESVVLLRDELASKALLSLLLGNLWVMDKVGDAKIWKQGPFLSSQREMQHSLPS